MKKILLPLLFFASLITAEAQTSICTPDTTITQPGMYPGNLPDAKINMSYNEVIQFKFPSDTTFNGIKVPIDSIALVQVDSLPAGFTFTCNDTNCTYDGGENGCVVVKGNPNASQAGNYTIFITGEGYARFGGVSLPPQRFTRSVDLNIVWNTALFTANKKISQNFEVSQNQPNPFSRNTLIEFNAPAAQMVSFKVYDILGHVIYSEESFASAGENTIRFERNGLKNGIYFYSLQMGDKRITKKMTIKD